jgi:hypothetical protein
MFKCEWDALLNPQKHTFVILYVPYRQRSLNFLSAGPADTQAIKASLLKTDHLTYRWILKSRKLLNPALSGSLLFAKLTGLRLFLLGKRFPDH